MLDVALGFLKDQLQEFLAARSGAGPDARPVNLTPVVNDQGRYSIALDSLGLTVINIEEERTFRAQVPTYVLVDGRQVLREPEVRLNVHVLASANFRQYGEALRHLALVIAFFQANPAFTIDAFPALDPRIGLLTAELYSLTYEQLNQVWAFIGAKQLPSVVYKVKVVVVQDEAIAQIGPPITTLAATLGGR